MKIRDLFSSQPQTFSFEFFPPKTTQEVDDLLVRAQALKALGPSFISVTYGAGGSTRRNTIDLVCRPSSPVNYGPFEAVLKTGARVPLRVMPAAAASACVSLLIDVRGPVGRPAFCSRLVLRAASGGGT